VLRNSIQQERSDDRVREIDRKLRPTNNKTRNGFDETTERVSRCYRNRSRRIHMRVNVVPRTRIRLIARSFI